MKEHANPNVSQRTVDLTAARDSVGLVQQDKRAIPTENASNHVFLIAQVNTVESMDVAISVVLVHPEKPVDPNSSAPREGAVQQGVVREEVPVEVSAVVSATS